MLCALCAFNVFPFMGKCISRSLVKTEICQIFIKLNRWAFRDSECEQTFGLVFASDVCLRISFGWTIDCVCGSQRGRHWTSWLVVWGNWSGQWTAMMEVDMNRWTLWSVDCSSRRKPCRNAKYVLQELHYCCHHYQEINLYSAHYNKNTSVAWNIVNL